jgi:hypothetical protein
MKWWMMKSNAIMFIWKTPPVVDFWSVADVQKFEYQAGLSSWDMHISPLLSRQFGHSGGITLDYKRVFMFLSGTLHFLASLSAHFCQLFVEVIPSFQIGTRDYPTILESFLWVFEGVDCSQACWYYFKSVHLALLSPHTNFIWQAESPRRSIYWLIHLPTTQPDVEMPCLAITPPILEDPNDAPIEQTPTNYHSIFLYIRSGLRS